MKNGVEVIVQEIGKADGSKYSIPFEHGHNSNIYRGDFFCKVL